MFAKFFDGENLEQEDLVVYREYELSWRKLVYWEFLPLSVCLRGMLMLRLIWLWNYSSQFGNTSYP